MEKAALKRVINRPLRRVGLELVRSAPRSKRPLQWASEPRQADTVPSRLVSFSLYGSHQRYLEGALRNADDYAQHFPGWTLIFFVGDSVPKSTIRSLEHRENTLLIPCARQPEDYSASLWRYSPLEWADVSAILFRDLDSRPSLRERGAVDEWLCSDRKFHVMRDHPFHTEPVLGGLWGAKKGHGLALASAAKIYGIDGRFGSDQRFIRQMLYPEMTESLLVHQDHPYFSDPAMVLVRKFPTKGGGKSAFVGQGFEADGKIRMGHEARTFSQ